MEIIKNLEIKLKNIFSDNCKKGIPLIFVIGCIGILLIFLSELMPAETSKREEENKMHIYENSEFEIKLESRLENEISKINGAGKTSVMLTVDSSKEYSYVKNSSDEKDESSSSKEQEVVIIEGKNGEEPVVFKVNEARIRGVLVICEGGENALVREKIIEAVCALLDIPSNKISVAKMA